MARIVHTAVPAQREGPRELPWILGASAAASAGAGASLFLQPEQAAPARRLAVAGVVAEGALMQVMQLRVGRIGNVYRQDGARRFSWAAKGLATAGAVVLARRGKESRAALVLGGTLVSAGELCLRWAVLKAGSQSTREEERT